MLFEPLFQHAQTQGDEIAIIDDRGRCTYRQLAGMARGMATVLASSTARPRIGLMLPSGAGFVASFYGALLAGKAVVPLNFLLGEKEIAHCIADSEIDAVVTAPPLAGRLAGSGLKIIDLSQLPPPATDALLPAVALPNPAADDLAVLMYTSGTSGLPKGVPLTYGNLQSNVDASIRHVNFQSRHRFLGVIPLFHVFGLSAMMLCPVQLGSTMVFMARFSPAGAVAAIRGHGISLMIGVPSMFAAMLRLKEAKPEDFKTIYAMLSGGEPLPAAVREGFASRFGVTLLEAYGMTETSLAISTNTPQANRPGSVGRPVPGIQLRIVDDNGVDVPDAQEGEIQVAGPMVMKAYHHGSPENTSASEIQNPKSKIQNNDGGFFKTGDIGKRDADGFLWITGRKKELIIVAGEKAAPREIEEVLLKHPAVAEAAVIGRKDASRGEVVVAFVVLRPGEAASVETLREFCRMEGLAQWKVPRQVMIVPDLPRSPSGKVLKRLLA